MSETWTARSEAEAALTFVLEDRLDVLRRALEGTDLEDAAQTILAGLAGRQYRLAPVLARRRVFVPARAPGPLPHILWMHTHCSHVETTASANTGPVECRACEENDEPWALLYVEEVQDATQPTQGHPCTCKIKPWCISHPFGPPRDVTVKSQERGTDGPT